MMLLFILMCGKKHLCDSNTAYKKNMGTSDAVTIDVIRSQWVLRNNISHTLRFEFDYDGWFDGIVKPLIEVTAEKMKFPENVITYWVEI